MQKERFSREFDFTMEFEKEMEECTTMEPPFQTWEELCKACAQRAARPKMRILKKSQVKKAAAVYRDALVIAKEYFAKANTFIDQEGVFHFHIHMDFLLELACLGSNCVCFLRAIKNSDDFHIVPIEKNQFDLVFIVELYENIPL